MTEEKDEYTMKTVESGNQSEVARLKEQIQLEYEAVHQAMYGPSLGAAQHEFITKRQENIAKHVEELRATVGEEAAMQVLIALQDHKDLYLNEQQ
jgi:hypothetical protein